MRQSLYFIGDSHANFKAIKKWNAAIENSILIHVGDFGMGFRGVIHKVRALTVHHLEKKQNRMYVIRGNHDDPRFFNGRKIGNIKFLPDNTMIELCGQRIFLCGGGHSIDRAVREPGVSWWDGEPFGWNEKVPPGGADIVVTHTAGSWAGATWKFSNMGFAPDLLHDLAEERRSVDKLFADLVKEDGGPKRWYFGHFHEAIRAEQGRTFFRGLAIDEIVEYRIP